MKNEKSVFLRLTRVGRFDTLLTRCAANGGAHPKIGPPRRAALARPAPLFENGTAFSGFALGRAAAWRGAGGGARQQSKFVLGNFKTNPKLERDRRTCPERKRKISILRRV